VNGLPVNLICYFLKFLAAVLGRLGSDFVVIVRFRSSQHTSCAVENGKL